jgi:hypothetical protein
MNDRQRILEQLRQQSLQARAQALYEQERRNRRSSPSATFAPGSISSGCKPEKGIGMYLTINIEDGFGVIKALVRMEYQGDDEGGKPTYGYTLIGGFAGATLNYDYGVGKWKFTLFDDVVTDEYYSDTLISSNWDGVPSPDTPAAGFTTCGYRELPTYCIDSELGLIQPLPTWFESQDENTEVPPIWSGFLLIFIWFPELGGPDGWFLSVGEEEDLIPGGSINELPLGEIPIGDGSVTVSAGPCEF